MKKAELLPNISMTAPLKLTPDSGYYLNEVDVNEPPFLQAHCGCHYAQDVERWESKSIFRTFHAGLARGFWRFKRLQNRKIVSADYRRWFVGQIRRFHLCISRIQTRCCVDVTSASPKQDSSVHFRSQSDALEGVPSPRTTVPFECLLKRDPEVYVSSSDRIPIYRSNTKM